MSTKTFELTYTFDLYLHKDFRSLNLSQGDICPYNPEEYETDPGDACGGKVGLDSEGSVIFFQFIHQV